MCLGVCVVFTIHSTLLGPGTVRVCGGGRYGCLGGCGCACVWVGVGVCVCMCVGVCNA